MKDQTGFQNSQMIFTDPLKNGDTFSVGVVL